MRRTLSLSLVFLGARRLRAAETRVVVGEIMVKSPRLVSPTAAEVAFDQRWVVSPGSHRLKWKDAVVEITVEGPNANEDYTVRYVVNGQQVDSCDAHKGAARIAAVGAFKGRVCACAFNGTWPPT
jgi:hypothetical protein